MMGMDNVLNHAMTRWKSWAKTPALLMIPPHLGINLKDPL